MYRHKRRNLSALIAIALLVACKNAPESPTLEYKVIGITGIVRNASGVLVQGANVQFTVLRPSCSNGTVDGTGTALTDSGGRYVQLLSSSASTDMRCIRVDAAAGGLSGRMELSGLHFDTRFPKDTVVVDVSIR